MRINLKFSVLFFFILCSLLSCNNQPQQLSKDEGSKKASLLHCYRYLNNHDTVILKTIDVNGIITGTLVYNLYEKDKNRGTIQGKMKGDLLIADYSFTSEGTLSVRQVVFKKSDTTFIEGYGDIEDKNGKTIFKNTDSLDFTNSIILNEYDCK